MDREQEQLELMMIRNLDGELSRDEQAELYRRLLRDPHAHGRMDDFADIDRTAREALDQVFPRRSRAGELDELLGSLPPRQSKSVGAWLWRHSAAIAAVILLGAGIAFSIRLHQIRQVEIAADNKKNDTPVLPVPKRDFQPVAPTRTVGTETDADALIDEAVPQIFDRSDRGTRSIDRGYYGVFDEENGTFYWFKLQREKTKVEPAGEDL